MPASLRTYRDKRNFAITQEPRGSRRKAGRSEPAFVVQKHAARRLHYDLRLEVDGVYKSWAVTRGPSIDPADKRLAVEVEDHPLEYGTFEGTIPAGEYGGGTVQLWDRGTWTFDGDATPAKALGRGELKFTLHGARLKGSWVLVRMKNDRAGTRRQNWLLIKHRDSFAGTARDSAALLNEDSGIASGLSMADIANARARQAKKSEAAATRARKPAASRTRNARVFIPPQLCKLVDRPPAGDDWVHEIKFDGYRMQLAVHGGAATLRTRKGLDWSRKFPAIVDAAARLPDCIMDGEIIASGSNGLADFAGLQAALSSGATDKLQFYLFDLLNLEGEDVRPAPLEARKERLRALLSRLPKRAAGLLRYVEHFTDAGDAVLESACRMELEGIVSKKLTAPYVSGRGFTWTKTKCRGGQEVVIGGWTAVGSELRSLLAGVYEAGKLKYVGRVGTGFGRATSSRVLPRLRHSAGSRSPFLEGDAPAKGMTVFWAKPELVAEIAFAGWTATGQLRQAAFKGLREDKSPTDITKERPAATPEMSRRKSSGSRSRPEARGPDDRGAPIVAGITVSNPDKVLWPAIEDTPAVTKLEMAQYYLAVSNALLPHVSGRPCSIVRAPDGIGKETFFQRHAMRGMSAFVKGILVGEDRKPYLEVGSTEALIALSQWAAIEFHPGNGLPGKPEVAGRVVFDLDPGPGVLFDEVVAAALEVRQRLEDRGLVAFCKTTGGKGLHVVTPLRPGRSPPAWEVIKAFSRRVCTEMAADHPERYVVNMAKNRRQGRIFLDYLRNDRLATAVAPFSLRARPGAPVSMPVAWSQVRKDMNPLRYTIHTVPGLLLRGMAWADYADGARPLRRKDLDVEA